MSKKPPRSWTMRVSDAMSKEIAIVTANSTMSEAADVLCEQRVTGAPVVDEMGHCIGVLSGTDFIHSKAAELGGEYLTSRLCSPRHPGETYFVDESPRDLVRRHMSPAVQTISSEASLLHAARCMCEEHIHRLIVLDEKEVPVGILSSLDLVAALVNAIEADM